MPQPSKTRTETHRYAGYGGYYSTPEEASKSIREHAAKSKSKPSGGSSSIKVYLGKTSSGVPVYKEVSLKDIEKAATIKQKILEEKYGKGIAEKIKIKKTREGYEITYPTYPSGEEEKVREEAYISREDLEKLTGKHYAGLKEQVPLWQAKEILKQEKIKFTEEKGRITVFKEEKEKPLYFIQKKEDFIRREIERRGVPIFPREKIDWEEKLLLGGLVLAEKIRGKGKGTFFSGIRKGLSDIVSGLYVTGYSVEQLLKRPRETGRFLLKKENILGVGQEVKYSLGSWKKEFLSYPSKEKLGYAAAFIGTTLAPSPKSLKIRLSETRLKFGGERQMLMAHAQEIARQKYKFTEAPILETKQRGTIETKPTLQKFLKPKKEKLIISEDKLIKIPKKKIETYEIRGEIFKYRGRGKAERLITETELPRRYKRGKHFVEVPEPASVKVTYKNFKPFKVTRVEGKRSFLKSQEASLKFSKERLRPPERLKGEKVGIYERVGRPLWSKRAPLLGTLLGLASLRGNLSKRISAQTSQQASVSKREVIQKQIQKEKLLQEQKIEQFLKLETETKEFLGKVAIFCFQVPRERKLPLPILIGSKARGKEEVKRTSAYRVELHKGRWVSVAVVDSKRKALIYGAKRCLSGEAKRFRVKATRVKANEIRAVIILDSWKNLRRNFRKVGDVYVLKEVTIGSIMKMPKKGKKWSFLT